ncbi:hypothetical protein H9Q72_009146 [Fusarium xylarioides]|uniref:Uncharacterized protein n=1 Tax=Fusarium xylarioides TaxID=221167 RepID=A0A9P7LKZ0_9HYPO|nr:hypothetical protein H9Q72_009146 [Fusarium xylarioides]KAG5808896.1 hypothetical protein H9Q71_006654 [Fusarium xylarioides]KAG5823459.1 hypothetical protein H9Q74_006437 [Fusarium xylarioides]
MCFGRRSTSTVDKAFTAHDSHGFRDMGYRKGTNGRHYGQYHAPDTQSEPKKENKGQAESQPKPRISPEHNTGSSGGDSGGGAETYGQ